MRMILIVLGALIVLGGAGAGGYYYFLNPAKASSGDEAAVDEAMAEAEKPAEKRPTFDFVELDPLVLPIVDKNGVSQVVSVMIAIDVPDEASKKSVEEMAPKLTSAFIQDLYGALNRHALTKGGALRVSYLKGRLNKVGAGILGEEQLNEVLLQVVQQRPI